MARVDVEHAAPGLDRGTALFNQACLSRRLNLQIQAMLQFREASEEWPAYEGRSDYWRCRAGSEFLSGDYNAAADSYERAIALGDSESETHELLCDSMLECGRHKDVIDAVRATPTATPDAWLTLLVAESIVDRFGIERQNANPWPLGCCGTQGGSLMMCERWQNLDAMVPACWWQPDRPSAHEDGSVEHPEYLLVAARLMDDSAEPWAMALILVALCGFPAPLIFAGVQRAHVKTGPRFAEALAEGMANVDKQDDDEANIILARLLKLAIEAPAHRSSRERTLTLTDSASGQPMLGIEYSD